MGIVSDVGPICVRQDSALDSAAQALMPGKRTVPPLRLAATGVNDPQDRLTLFLGDWRLLIREVERRQILRRDDQVFVGSKDDKLDAVTGQWLQQRRTPRGGVGFRSTATGIRNGPPARLSVKLSLRIAGFAIRSNRSQGAQHRPKSTGRVWRTCGALPRLLDQMDPHGASQTLSNRKSVFSRTIS